jgi:hypothetical protein
MLRDSRALRLATTGTLLLSLAAAGRAHAQARTIANLVVGDAVMAVKAGADKHVYVGVSSGTHTSLLTASAAAVDEFVAETEAIVRLGSRPLPTNTIERPELQDPDSGRTLSVTRHLAREHGPTQVTYHFFVSDERLTGYVVPATPAETKSILLALHRAARAALGSDQPPAKKTRPGPGTRAAQSRQP